MTKTTFLKFCRRKFAEENIRNFQEFSHNFPNEKSIYSFIQFLKREKFLEHRATKIKRT